MVDASTRAIFLFLMLTCGNIAATSAVADENLSACDFITQAEVESLLGKTVGQPFVSSRGSCLGWCESEDTSRCDFPSSATTNSSSDFWLEISFPPFLEPEQDLPRDVWQLMTSDIVAGRDLIEDVPGFDGTAIYDYRADIGIGSLEVFDKRHLIFRVVLPSAFDQHKAFATVLRAASFVLKHFEAMPASRLKQGFEHVLPEGGHPWHP